MDQSQHIELGGLSCVVVDALPPGTQPEKVVVLCHGFGAGGTDLVGLAPEYLSASESIARRYRFVFPAALLSLDEIGMFGARAWWPLDVERLMLTIQRGEFRNLRNDLPEGLLAAREGLLALIAEIGSRYGVGVENLVLGGFSQGAMLATDVALRLEQKPAGLCVYSGTLLCEDEWRALAANRGELPIVMSHGRQDPILPFEAAEWLRDMLVESGLPVNFVPFDGPHTISAGGLQAMVEMLESL